MVRDALDERHILTLIFLHQVPHGEVTTPPLSSIGLGTHIRYVFGPYEPVRSRHLDRSFPYYQVSFPYNFSSLLQVTHDID